jgi:hypothetical protein
MCNDGCLGHVLSFSTTLENIHDYVTHYRHLDAGGPETLPVLRHYNQELNVSQRTQTQRG